MIAQFAAWLTETPASLAVQEALWAVPVVQTVHILAIASLIFSTLTVNVAVVRRGRGGETPEWLGDVFLWVWGSAFVLLLSGGILIVGEPNRSLLNSLFRAKVVLIVVAVALTILLQRSLIPAEKGDGSSKPARLGPRKATALALVSSCVWLVILTLGRFIAYFGDPSA